MVRFILGDLAHLSDCSLVLCMFKKSACNERHCLAPINLVFPSFPEVDKDAYVPLMKHFLIKVSLNVAMLIHKQRSQSGHKRRPN